MLKKRILAIDVGKKRIGVAQSDKLHITANPLGTFSPKDFFLQVAKWLKTDEYEAIIVGWPLTLSGQEGESIHMVRSFLGELKKIAGTIPIHTLDERFTSTIAQQSLRESGLSKKMKNDKGIIDTQAAVVLLQDFLNKS